MTMTSSVSAGHCLSLGHLVGSLERFSEPTVSVKVEHRQLWVASYATVSEAGVHTLYQHPLALLLKGSDASLHASRL